MLKITVPASSANLGAGFDALGLGADPIQPGVDGGGGRLPHSKPPTGRRCPLDESNMIYHTARLLYDALRPSLPGAAYPPGEQYSHDPGAGELLPLAWWRACWGPTPCWAARSQREDICDLATELEGHPDNVAPALLGGLVTSVMDGGRVHTVSVPVTERIRFAVFIPDFELKTEVARGGAAGPGFPGRCGLQPVPGGADDGGRSSPAGWITCGWRCRTGCISPTASAHDPRERSLVFIPPTSWARTAWRSAAPAPPCWRLSDRRGGGLCRPGAGPTEAGRTRRAGGVQLLDCECRRRPAWILPMNRSEGLAP